MNDADLLRVPEFREIHPPSSIHEDLRETIQKGSYYSGHERNLESDVFPDERDCGGDGAEGRRRIACF